MNKWFMSLALASVSYGAQAAPTSLTVYQDPHCGCCEGWVEHMRDAGFQVNAVKTLQMAAVKQKLGVPMELSSCHTGVVDATGQRVEGHVPAHVVRKMLADPGVTGVAAPGMPLNAPGMGKLDGNLITVDFNGKPFSRD